MCYNYVAKLDLPFKRQPPLLINQKMQLEESSFKCLRLIGVGI